MNRPSFKLPLIMAAAVGLSSCSLLDTVKSAFTDRVHEAAQTQKLVLRSTPHTELRFDDSGLTQVLTFDPPAVKEHVSAIVDYTPELRVDPDWQYEPSPELVSDIDNLILRLRGRQEYQPPVFMNINTAP